MVDATPRITDCETIRLGAYLGFGLFNSDTPAVVVLSEIYQIFLDGFNCLVGIDFRRKGKRFIGKLGQVYTDVVLCCTGRKFY